jgi:hypothetical protein
MYINPLLFLQLLLFFKNDNLLYFWHMHCGWHLACSSYFPSGSGSLRAEPSTS